MAKKAGYKISSSVNEGIFEFILTGKIVENEIDMMLKEFNAMVLASGINYVLMDVRAIKGRYGYTGAYQRVRSHPQEFYSIIKTAIVDLPENSVYRNYHETTARNAGMNLKWFTDIDEARAWLKISKKEKTESS